MRDSRYRTQSLRLRRLRFTARTGIIIEHGASFQSSPKINRMLITRLICIQWKSSRFLFPVSTVSARNAWDHGRPFGVRHTKENACIFRVNVALIKQARLNNMILNIWLEPVLCLVLLCLLPVVMADILVSVLGYYFFATVSHLHGSGTVFYRSSVWWLICRDFIAHEEKMYFWTTYLNLFYILNCFQLKTASRT